MSPTSKCSKPAVSTCYWWWYTPLDTLIYLSAGTFSWHCLRKVTNTVLLSSSTINWELHSSNSLLHILMAITVEIVTLWTSVEITTHTAPAHCPPAQWQGQSKTCCIPSKSLFSAVLWYIKSTFPLSVLATRLHNSPWNTCFPHAPCSPLGCKAKRKSL